MKIWATLFMGFDGAGCARNICTRDERFVIILAINKIFSAERPFLVQDAGRARTVCIVLTQGSSHITRGERNCHIISFPATWVA